MNITLLHKGMDAQARKMRSGVIPWWACSFHDLPTYCKVPVTIPLTLDSHVDLSLVAYKHFLCVADAPSKVLDIAIGLNNFRRKLNTEAASY